MCVGSGGARASDGVQVLNNTIHYLNPDSGNVAVSVFSNSDVSRIS